MTTAEATAIDRLRTELHEYHCTVIEVAKGCESCKKQIAMLSLDMYGVPGETDKHPGVIASVNGMSKTVRVVWGILLVLLGAAASAIARQI
jgi:hypothetical protein